MIDTPMSADPVPLEAVEAQLSRVLDSETFRGAERSRALLRFIVGEAVQGRADRLKEYVLGVGALGRGEGFDPRTDPIARVEASRLRSRLDLYYGAEGASDRVRISLPKGGYAPAIEWRLPATMTIEVKPSESVDAPALRSAEGAGPWSYRALMGGAALALFAGLGAWLLSQSSDLPAPEVRLEMVTPPTTDPVSLAVSPDGRSVVFVASTDGSSRLWVRRLDSATPRELAGTEYASHPFWAPDGQSIGFFAEGRIKAVELETGLVRVIATALVPAGAAWNEDGVILHPVVPDGPLFQTSRGTPPTPVTQLEAGQTGHRGPVFLPDGRHFLFYAMGTPVVRGIYVAELGAVTVRRLAEADTPAVFVAPDHLLYVRDSTLFAHRIDPRAVVLQGRPISLAEGIDTEARGGVAAFSASGGTIAYRAGRSAGARQFRWLDRRGDELSRVGPPDPSGPSYASLAPDGRRLAVQRSVDGNTDIWLVDIERSTPIRLTTDPQADIAPVWSPRGDRVVYASQQDGAFQLIEKALDGSPARLLLSTSQNKQVTDWSRDGRYLLFRTIALEHGADVDIWALPLEDDRTPFPVVRTPFEERDAQFSPDGNWIAYHSNESGQYEVYVQPWRAEGERMRISTGGGAQARWRSDGRELFYLTLQRELVSVPMTKIDSAGRSLQPGRPVTLFRADVGSVQGVALHSYNVSPDGQRFLVESVIEEMPPPISLIVNWRAPDRR